MILENLGDATSTTDLISHFSTVKPIRACCSECCLRSQPTSSLGNTFLNDQCHLRETECWKMWASGINLDSSRAFLSTGKVCCEVLCMTVWILLILCMTIQNHVRVWDDLFYKENLEWVWCLRIVVMEVFNQTSKGSSTDTRKKSTSKGLKSSTMNEWVGIWTGHWPVLDLTLVCDKSTSLSTVSGIMLWYDDVTSTFYKITIIII